MISSCAKNRVYHGTLNNQELIIYGCLCMKCLVSFIDTTKVSSHFCLDNYIPACRNRYESRHNWVDERDLLLTFEAQICVACLGSLCIVGS